jgi:histone deacetylase complex subunit SAP30
VTGNASYSRSVQLTVAQRRLRIALDPAAGHAYICDHHKNIIQAVRRSRPRRVSEDDSGDPEDEEEGADIDLMQLQINTLRRYKRQFKVSARPGLSKAQLAETCNRHFQGLPVADKETIATFVYMIKKSGSKLDKENVEKPVEENPMDVLDRLDEGYKINHEL